MSLDKSPALERRAPSDIIPPMHNPIRPTASSATTPRLIRSPIVGALSLGSLLLAACTPPVEGIRADQLARHVEYLASDELQGRGFATPGEKLAADYIARQLKAAGLRPPAGWNDPIQRFDAASGAAAHNVVFALPGRDPKLRDQWIVVGAHLDHLGVRGGEIYHGADDNASGCAGVIEVAKAFARRLRKPGRSLLFCFFTGEERGFIGSRHLAEHMPVPMERVVAMVNADMISRDETRSIHVVGPQTADSLRAVVERANEPIGLNLLYDHPEWTYQSDHFVFFRQKVPFVYFGVDDHEDYHEPTDTADKINRDLIEAVSRLVYRTVEILADEPSAPQWNPEHGLSPRSETPGAP
jgi:hypothetical protein